MARIETLTNEQWGDMLRFREEWYGIGSATGPTVRNDTQHAITALYRAAGYAKPQYVFTDSPATAVLAQHVLRKYALRDALRASLGDALWTSLGDALRDALEASLGASLWGSLGDSLRASLRVSLRDALRDSLRASLGDALRASLGASLWASLGDALRASLRDALRASLGDALRASLGASLWGSLRDALRGALRGALNTCFWGQHESWWVAYYAFMPRIGVVYDTKDARILQHWAQMCQSCGWWWPYRDVCVVASRPTTLRVDAQRRLHAETGPAMAFADGYAVWAWHGVRVPQHVIEAPHTITLEHIRQEMNAERHRVMIERWGWDKYLEASHATLVDVDTEPSGAPGLRGLYRCDAGVRDNGRTMQVLVCSCASTGKTFSLEVPPDVLSCRQAANWLAHTDNLHLLVRT